MHNGRVGGADALAKLIHRDAQPALEARDREALSGCRAGQLACLEHAPASVQIDEEGLQSVDDLASIERSVWSVTAALEGSGA